MQLRTPHGRIREDDSTQLGSTPKGNGHLPWARLNKHFLFVRSERAFPHSLRGSPHDSWIGSSLQKHFRARIPVCFPRKRGSGFLVLSLGDASPIRSILTPRAFPRRAWDDFTRKIDNVVVLLFLACFDVPRCMYMLVHNTYTYFYIYTCTKNALKTKKYEHVYIYHEHTPTVHTKGTAEPEAANTRDARVARRVVGGPSANRGWPQRLWCPMRESSSVFVRVVL